MAEDIRTDLKLLTKQQVDTILKKNVGSEGNQLLYAGASTAIDVISAAVIASGNPIGLAGTTASIATFLTGLFGVAEESAGMVLDVASLGMALEQKINYGIDKLVSIADNEAKWKPDSLLYDAQNWNKILGSALNYGTTSEDRVVEWDAENDCYDFRKMFKFQTVGIVPIDMYLSQEFKYLLNINLGRKEF